MRAGSLFIYILLALEILLCPLTVQANEYRVVKAEEILKHIENGEEVNYNGCHIVGELNVSKIKLEIVPNQLFYNFNKMVLVNNGLSENLRVIESNITIINSVFENDLNFTNVIFNGSANFSNSNFNSSTNFSYSTFNVSAIFNHSTFDSYANFEHSTFNIYANFEHSTFNSFANFFKSTFNNNAGFFFSTFNSSANFSFSIFDMDGYFTNVNFNDLADFSNTKFRSNARFTWSTFNKSVNLPKAIFNNSVDFAWVNFNSSANFFNSTFNNSADFSNTKFKSSANFLGVIFKNSADFSKTIFNSSANFRDAKFNDLANFSGTNINSSANYSNTNFNKFADFSNTNFNDFAKFSNTKFKSSANFLGAKFKSYADFWDSTFNSSAAFLIPNTPENIYANGKTCELFIKSYTEEARYTDADSIYFNFRKRSQKEKNITDFSKWTDAISFVTCGYGTRISYTLLLIGVIIIFFAILYRNPSIKLDKNKNNKIFLRLDLGIPGIYKVSEKNKEKSMVSVWESFEPEIYRLLDVKSTVSIWDCLYFSINAFTRLGSSDWDAKDNFRKVVTLEGFIGWIMLAIFMSTLTHLMHTSL